MSTDFNEDFNNRRSSAPPLKTKKPGPKGKLKEKTVAWGGLPGKTQPKDRSGGVKKLKIHPVSIGL